MKVAKTLLVEFRTGKGLKGQLLRGGFWSLIIKLLSTALALVLAIVLARILGPEGFGVYSLIFALVSIFTIPAQLGLPNLVVRETAKAQAEQRWDIMKGLWRWSSRIAIGMSALLLCLGAVVIWAFGDQLRIIEQQTVWWGLLLIPIVALGNLRGSALRGLNKVVQGQLPEYILRPLLLVILTLIVSFGLEWQIGPAEAMRLHVAAAATAFFVGACLLLHARPKQLATQKESMAKSSVWLASAIPLGLAVGMQTINQNVGIVVLGALRPPEEVGLLRLATQAASVVAFALTSANLVIAPYLADAFARGNVARMQHIARASARGVIAVSIPAAIVLIAFGRDIITFFVGNDYAGAYEILVILVIGNIAGSVFCSSSTILNMTGHERYVFRVMVFATLVGLLLSFILIHIWGSMGCAVAISLTKLFWNYILAKIVHAKLNIDSTAFGLFGGPNYSAPNLK